MIPVEHSPHPPGTIGLVTGELARFTEFPQSLLKLFVPSGTGWYWAKSGSVARNCNQVCEHMSGDWVWFMGDDHAFNPDHVMRLLDHRVDVVVPLCAQRGFPYMPVVFTPSDTVRDPQLPHFYEIRQWSDLPTSGLICEIEGKPIRTGQAGMLVRRHVLEAIGGPYWFEFGRLAPDQPGEDLWFAEKVLKAGFKIWLDCDPARVLDHIAVHRVRPVPTPTGWAVEFNFGKAKLRTRVKRGAMAPVTESQEAAEVDLYTP